MGAIVAGGYIIGNIFSFGGYGDEDVFVGALIVTIVALIEYFLTKRVYFRVEYAGGRIIIDVSRYGGMREIRSFNKELHLAKDKCRQIYRVSMEIVS